MINTSGPFQDARALVTQYLTSKHGANPDGLIWIGGDADGWRGRCFATVPEAADYAVHLDGRGGKGVYHRASTLRAAPEDGRGAIGDTATVYYFGSDLDLAGAGHKRKDGQLPNAPDHDTLVRILAEAGFKEPTSWTHSGGGEYAEWFLIEPVSVRDDADLQRVKALWERLSQHLVDTAKRMGFKVDNTRDLARVYRLPGTTNRKPEMVAERGEQPCRVLSAGGPRYTLDELEAFLPQLVVHTPVVPPAPILMDPGPIGGVAREGHDVEWMKGQLDEQVRRVAAGFVDPRHDGMHQTIVTAALMFGHAIPCGLVSESEAERVLTEACAMHYGAADENDRTHIRRGLRDGQANAWRLAPPAAPDAPRIDRRGREDLNVSNPAVVVDWLADNAGRGKLSGLFKRGAASIIVHTPRIGERGYVAPRGDEDDDGPAQVMPLSPAELAAKCQFAWSCYSERKAKEDTPGAFEVRPGEWITRTPALFPEESAKRAINARDQLPHLRRLKGVTHVPTLRRDGSLLDVPGYDPASGLLFLPESGVVVPPLADRPSPEQVAGARDFLLFLIGDFPFITDQDRSNMLGMLLTPLLGSLLRPEARKLFMVTAHQAGSGKTLLAKLAKLIFGGVFKAELPEDDAELRKAVTTILNQTTAPTVIIDNVTGLVKSSTLAGLATSYEWDDRKLGSNDLARCVNDRTWIMTGNNAALGGDMARRTVWIRIDPGRPNPEQRTPDEFRIPDLEAFVQQHRGSIVHALLTLVRAWVVAGRSDAPGIKRSTDSYGEWRAAVSGILALAGVPGGFDEQEREESVQDVEWGNFLGAVHDVYGSAQWTAAELLDKVAMPGGLDLPGVPQARPISLDVLPGDMFDKALRAGNTRVVARSLGWWLKNHEGRWAGSLSVRRGAVDGKKIQRWYIDRA